MAKLALIDDSGTIVTEWNVERVTDEQMEDLSFDMPTVSIDERGVVDIGSELATDISLYAERGEI